jgi:hypothetical protein
MAVQFHDTTATWVTITDPVKPLSEGGSDDALTLPAGSWSLGGWVWQGEIFSDIPPGQGSLLRRYLLSWEKNATGGVPSFHIWLNEMGTADNVPEFLPGWIYMTGNDGVDPDGGEVKRGPLYIGAPNIPQPLMNVWRHVLFVKDTEIDNPNTVMFVYIDGNLIGPGQDPNVEPGPPPVTDDGVGPGGGGPDEGGGGADPIPYEPEQGDIWPDGKIDVEADFYFGGQATPEIFDEIDSGSSARNHFHSGIMAHWAKWDRIIYPWEVQMLWRGVWPFELHDELKWYLPMEGAILPTMHDWANNDPLSPMTVTATTTPDAVDNASRHAPLQGWGPLGPPYHAGAQGFEGGNGGGQDITWYYRQVRYDRRRD